MQYRHLTDFERIQLFNNYYSLYYLHRVPGLAIVQYDNLPDWKSKQQLISPERIIKTLWFQDRSGLAYGACLPMLEKLDLDKFKKAVGVHIYTPLELALKLPKYQKKGTCAPFVADADHHIKKVVFHQELSKEWLDFGFPSEPNLSIMTPLESILDALDHKFPRMFKQSPII